MSTLRILLLVCIVSIFYGFRGNAADTSPTVSQPGITSIPAIPGTWFSVDLSKYPDPILQTFQEVYAFAQIHTCDPYEAYWREYTDGPGHYANLCPGIENQRGAIRWNFSGKFDPLTYALLVGISDIELDVVAATPMKEIYPTYPYSDDNGDFYIDLNFTYGSKNPKLCTSDSGTYTRLTEYTGYYLFHRPRNFQTVRIHCEDPISSFNFRQGNPIFTSVDASVFIQKVSFRFFGASNLKLLTNSLNENEDPIGTAQPHDIKDGDTITLPLGGLTSLELTDENNQAIAASYELNNDFVVNPGFPFDNRFTMNAFPRLFPNANSQLFLQTSPNAQQLMGVHLGKQTLKITPVDTSRSPVSLHLNIVAPDTLGVEVDNHSCGSYSDCDDLIIQMAHQSGIAPQFIKAQIYQESNFVPTAFRYEPGIDKSNFKLKSGPIASKNIAKFSLDSRFAPFLFKGDSNLLSDANKYLRSKYYVNVNGSYRTIANNYETSTGRYKALLANEIYSKSGPRYAPLTTSESDFIAQTATASSYGLLQVLYTTAVVDLAFTNGEAGQSPINLTDPDTNAFYASKYLLKVIKLVNGSALASPQTFQSWKDQILFRTFAAYNGGPGGYQKSEPQRYGNSIIFRSKALLPKTKTTIFDN